MINYKDKPFYLNDEDIKWVEKTFKSMSIEEKIGQLFFPIGYSSDPNYLKYAMLNKYPGGMLFRTGKKQEMAETYAYLQKESRIPMFTAANLEAGGDGIAEEGTSFGKQMQIAATNNPDNAYLLGKVCAREGKAVGCNYAFAPVVDIDLNYHNPITNVRTYGSNPSKVIEYAREYIKACNEEGVLTSIKHFPGDGVDECDQHILTSVNSLSKEKWDESYGKVYKTLIDEGVKTVMVGHIALPCYQSEDNRLLPASLSSELINGLLREKLGFNGMVITDATPMVGFCSAMARKDAVPAAINAGCDMFLFNKDYDEDYQFMMDAYKEGVLKPERLEEAVKRILACKASQKLHLQNNVPDLDKLDVVGCDEHKNWARKCADEAITLVKDSQNLLPISSLKTKKVLYEILGDSNSNKRIEETFVKKMQEYGYEMIPYQKEEFDFNKPLPFDSVKTFKEKYDLVIYIGNIENASNKTTNRINWYTLFGLGNNMPWFVKEVPTMFISLQNPYHLLDVPMIQTYINCYSNHSEIVECAVDKINGKGSFKGVSPIDPFCGKEYLKY